MRVGDVGGLLALLPLVDEQAIVCSAETIPKHSYVHKVCTHVRVAAE